MKDRYTVVPMLKIVPGMVIQYSLLDPRPVRSPLDITAHNQNAPPVGLYSGLLTASSKKRLIKAINLLIAISVPKKAVHFDSKVEFTFRVNFITLTLPAPQGPVSDKELKQRCLKQWLEYWKDQLPGMSYVWRAERQGNGNLHFHLITDRYIHYEALRESWNRALAPLGFIEAFKRKNGHEHPNSTDVHAVKAIRNLAAYIAKYMSKKEKEGKPVDGRLWDCSRNLKAKNQCAFPIGGADHLYFQELCESMASQAFTTDWCAGVRITEAEARKLFPNAWKKEYRAYLARVRGR